MPVVPLCIPTPEAFHLLSTLLYTKCIDPTTHFSPSLPSITRSTATIPRASKRVLSLLGLPASTRRTGPWFHA
ncbi:hypothetical protein J3R82DRAFT_6418 [Butyriboletus roseoflavus]|nr:hypothetical protein J3R82DRAFT_6418 [Butyriboletus roseoflavus]